MWIPYTRLEGVQSIEDRETGNVFADYLEEKGELRAAELLREAFATLRLPSEAFPLTPVREKGR
jgi:hypothetical protein